MQYTLTRFERRPEPMEHPGTAASHRQFHRRAFLGVISSLLPMPLLAQAVTEVHSSGAASATAAPDPALITDTFNGLIAFVVPGSDPWSIGQGVSTPGPGGISANIVQGLIFGLDVALPVPSLSATVAELLNGISQQISPQADGPFPSPFARLKWAEKAAVFQFLEGDASTAPFRVLSGLLIPVVAFAIYSEVSAFDPEKRTLTGTPVGWTLSNYSGVANGRNEFKGYFEGRTAAGPTYPRLSPMEE